MRSRVLVSIVASGSILLGCRAWTKDQVVPHEPADPVDTSTHTDPEGEVEPATSPSADGPALDRDEIRVVVRAKMPNVRACFDAGLEADPTIGGRVLLRFTIGPDGRVSQSEVVEDQLGQPVVTTCLQAELGNWQFPHPRGETSITINYPFVFSSEHSLRAAGLPRVEGTLDPAAVGAVFTARREELDSCVTDNLKGTVGVALTIDEQGVVTRISSYANTLDERSRACVVRTVSSWKFPPAAAGDEARVNHDLYW